MRNYCEQVVHSHYDLHSHYLVHSSVGLQPTAVVTIGRRPSQGPSGRPVTRPAVGTYEGWVTTYGVCGHLLFDSLTLSAWRHSATLFKNRGPRNQNRAGRPSRRPLSRVRAVRSCSCIDPVVDHRISGSRVSLNSPSRYLKRLNVNPTRGL